MIQIWRNQIQICIWPQPAVMYQTLAYWRYMYLLFAWDWFFICYWSISMFCNTFSDDASDAEVKIGESCKNKACNKVSKFAVIRLSFLIIGEGSLSLFSRVPLVLNTSLMLLEERIPHYWDVIELLLSLWYTTAIFELSIHQLSWHSARLQ